MRYFAGLTNWLDRERGQTLAEYGLLIAVIAVGAAVALGLVALAISGSFQSVTDCVMGGC